MPAEPFHPHIREGFPGQRMLVLPQPVVRGALARGPATDLLPTDIGCFPNAAWHDVQRTAGVPQMIVIYCVRGFGRARIAGRTVDVTPGDVLIIPPNVSHAYGSGGSHPWTIYWFHLAGRKVAAVHRLITDGGAGNVFQLGEDSEFLSLFEETYDMLHQGYGPDQLLMASLSIGRLMAVLILRRRGAQQVHSPGQRIDGTIAFMKQRLDKHVAVPELARLANLSCSHYAAIFKSQVGFSPLDYFIRLKMRRACQLLDTTQLPVKLIADDLGFADALYFSRKFRQIHNLSPSQYRALKKG